MSSDVREVRLPDELCNEAERRFGAQFIVAEGLIRRKMTVDLSHYGLDALYVLFRLVTPEYFGYDT